MSTSRRAFRKVNKERICLRAFLLFPVLFQWTGKFWSHILTVALKSDSGLGIVASIFLLLEPYCAVPRCVGVSKTNLASHSFVSSDNATLEAGLQNIFQLAGLLI